MATVFRQLHATVLQEDGTARQRTLTQPPRKKPFVRLLCLHFQSVAALDHDEQRDRADQRRQEEPSPYPEEDDQRVPPARAQLAGVRDGHGAEQDVLELPDDDDGDLCSSCEAQRNRGSKGAALTKIVAKTRAPVSNLPIAPRLAAMRPAKL